MFAALVDMCDLLIQNQLIFTSVLIPIIIIVVRNQFADNIFFACRNLASFQDREICCYSVSCKDKDNIGMKDTYFVSLFVDIIIVTYI